MTAAATMRSPDALAVYESMRRKGLEPSVRVVLDAVRTCTRYRNLQSGLRIHEECFLLCGSNAFLASALVNMYVRCGRLQVARDVLEEAAAGSVAAWNTLCLGYAENGEVQLAFEVYCCMEGRGYVPDSATFVAVMKACSRLAQNVGECLEMVRAVHGHAASLSHDLNIFVAGSLVSVYSKCSSLADARRLFEKMVGRDLVVWNCMVMGYAEAGEGWSALELFGRMQTEGFTPDSITFHAAVKACSAVASLEAGMQVHQLVCKAGLDTQAALATSLVDFYGKSGCMVEAERAFEKAMNKDVAAWGALIAGYSRQGDAKRVFELLEAMPQQPDEKVLLAVLTVCRHTGLVEEGRKWFLAMTSDYGLVPSSEHYNCMVDLLASSSQLAEAIWLVARMPTKPNDVTWTVILSSARKWKNLVAGRLAFEALVAKNGAACASTRDMYVELGLLEEASLLDESRNRLETNCSG